ncbi:MAG: hypothetical protein HY360_19750 [Verrucomicrobia bacterium]|nr:hypothetical protein [Verrucomicrobiota bacterium]
MPNAEYRAPNEQPKKEGNMSNENLKERTKKFALAILNLVEKQLVAIITQSRKTAQALNNRK